MSRKLAWFAIAAQAAFVAAWIIAGALQRHYSQSRSFVSALAAHGMRDPGLMIAAFVVLGLGLAALGVALRPVLPRRRAATVAAALFALAGAGFVIAGLFRLDCDISVGACHARYEAGTLGWHSAVHLWAALLTQVALVLTPFAIARVLWPSPAGALALGSGTTGVAIGAAAWIAGGAGAPDGVVERLQLLAVHAWVAIVAVGILYETRRPPRLSAPAPLRPRDFFGSAWAGEGVVCGIPPALWRPFGPRFQLSRTTRWHSDEVAVVRDRAVLSSGRVEERVRFARFTDPCHIHVSSDDMPDGADVTIDEAGYRVAPYRVHVPVGPLRFTVRSHDEARVDADGTLRYACNVSWLGLPVARVEMTARPVDTEGWPHAATPSRSHATG